ncbi:TetR family transcriptional regulator [Jiangella ureilytica]|uniref:TetR family transcriptional regulator n=1 Tax=Jiangella ureilytica TaxID=2530374 RepID=A0A4R4RDY5_9ACTN|nr:TetR family transcriptional regulator [Jiangella ureilytica]
MHVAADAEVGPARAPLSRDRVLRAAVRIADDGGLGALTMRRLAEDLGAEAMSLYYHVANKDEVLDGIADAVGREINEVVDALDVPSAGPQWKQAVRRRILAAREVLLRHPWVPAVFETRAAMSPEILRYHDRLLGLMRDGGFSYDLAHHALHALGSRALGFSQELFTPAAGGGGAGDGDELADLAERLPNLAGLLEHISHDDPGSTLGWCDDQEEFEFGLDLLLDGLDRLRERSSS